MSEVFPEITLSTKINASSAKKTQEVKVTMFQQRVNIRYEERERADAVSITRLLTKSRCCIHHSSPDQEQMLYP